MNQKQLMLEAGYCLSAILFLQCAGWLLESLHYTHCKKNLYHYFLASNSDTCRNVRSFAAWCTDAGSQRVAAAVPLFLNMLRQVRLVGLGDGRP